MKLTDRQNEIINLVGKGESGNYIDIDKLMVLLMNTPSKQAVQCSIRILERKGLLTRSYVIRRGRKRMVLSISLIL